MNVTNDDIDEMEPQSPQVKDQKAQQSIHAINIVAAATQRDGESGLSTLKQEPSVTARSRTKSSKHRKRRSGTKNKINFHLRDRTDDDTSKYSVLYPKIVVTKWFKDVTQKNIDFLEMLVRCEPKSISKGLPIDNHFLWHFQSLDPLIKKWKLKSNYYYLYLLASLPYRRTLTVKSDKYFDDSDGKSTIQIIENTNALDEIIDSNTVIDVTSSNSNNRKQKNRRKGSKHDKSSLLANQVSVEPESKESDSSVHQMVNYSYCTQSYNISYNVMNILPKTVEAEEESDRSQIMGIKEIELSLHDLIIEKIDNNNNDNKINNDQTPDCLMKLFLTLPHSTHTRYGTVKSYDDINALNADENDYDHTVFNNTSMNEIGVKNRSNDDYLINWNEFEVFSKSIGNCNNNGSSGNTKKTMKATIVRDRGLCFVNPWQFYGTNEFYNLRIVLFVPNNTKVSFSQLSLRFEYLTDDVFMPNTPHAVLVRACEQLNKVRFV